MERGQQDLVTLNKELEQAKVVEEKDTGTRTTNKEIQMEELQETIANREMKENKLRQQIEEAKPWAQIVKCNIPNFDFKH